MRRRVLLVLVRRLLGSLVWTEIAVAGSRRRR